MVATLKREKTVGRSRRIPSDDYAGKAAARLRLLRERAGHSVADMVKLLQEERTISTAQYYRYESGESEMTASLAADVAKVLGVKPRTVLPE